MKQYQACTHCIMDTTDASLTFNQDGVCHYCQTLKIKYENNFARTQTQIDHDLKMMAQVVKNRAGKSKYNCVLGVSGGVDSSYTADLIVTKLGLNPLIVHFDNNWNSAIAVDNIKKIVTQLKLDMITYVIDWEEFKDLQRAFFHASVLDIEMLTDNAIFGATIKIAKQYKIKSIITGDNFATESGLPSAWRWEKLDTKNIKAIHRQYGTRKLQHFPLYSFVNYAIDRTVNKFAYFSPLNLIQYNKQQAMQHLHDQFSWIYYGGKHYESMFTKFYQAYILPTKFGIDKRRAHLSSLIRNRELTRDEACSVIAKPLYDDINLQQDIAYVQKKLGFSESEFQAIMASAPKAHTDYPSDLKLLMNGKRLFNSSWFKAGLTNYYKFKKAWL